MDLPILIMAAGQSSRMRGVDKLLEPVDGEPLLARQIAAARTVSDAVFVALPDETHPRMDIVAQTPAAPINVPEANQGFGITLRTAVAKLPPCPAFMIVLADLVELEAADYARMFGTWRAEPDHVIWRGATAAGKPGHPIIFNQNLRDAFKTLKGDTGGAAILRAHAQQTCLVPLAGERALRDLDTPEDWATWRAQTGR